jgi:nicotinamidase-related amidase
VDTYDVRSAIEKIIAAGRKPRGIRLDSGDVLTDSIWVRQRLDGIGWTDVHIFVSGDLTEERIEALLAGGGRADSFGVGTALSTSADSPSVGVIYKLVEVEFANHIRDTAKFSAEKKTYPGRKQVFRFSTEEGMFLADVIALEDEMFSGAELLLVQVMHKGRRLEVASLSPAVTARNARSTFLAGRKRLPPRFLTLSSAMPFPVRYSDRLERLCDQIRHIFVEAAPESPSRASRSGVGASVSPIGPTVNLVSPNTIFWAVDVQADFMQPEGKLYVPDAEKVIPNISRLVEAAREGRVLLVSSADAHKLEDPELQQWPPHCLKGTPGASLIPEACAATRLVVPNQKGFALPDRLSAYQQVVVEKNTLDVFDNPNTELLLARIAPVGSPPFDPGVEFFVFGVVTEHCVRCTVEGLLRRGRRVAVVTDAIQALDPATGQRIVVDLQTRGARLVTTVEALAQLIFPLARSA